MNNTFQDGWPIFGCGSAALSYTVSSDWQSSSKKVATFDELVKSQKVRFPVIPAKAGIQLFQILKNSLDSGFHRSDDFLRVHQI